jgi:hypothetical protein
MAKSKKKKMGQRERKKKRRTDQPPHMLFYLFLLIEPKALRQPLYVILSHVVLCAFINWT